MRRLGVLCACLALNACASAPRTMSYDIVDLQGDNPSWPAAPQVPRIEYEGQLVGEVNFIVEDEELSGGQRFLRWLAGLGSGGRKVEQLVRPQSGMVDTSGRILVTDAGRPSVFVFDEANGDFDVWREAADGVDFVSPVGIAQLNANEFIIADAELGAVFVLTTDGKPLRQFAAGQFSRPTGVDVDAGLVYVADKDERTIKVFAATGELLRSIGVAGDTPESLNAPMHLRVADGRVYVSDALNAHVLIYSTEDGGLLGSIGRRGLYVGNFVRPKGIAVDSDGHVYVVESYYDHLLVYDSAGQFLLPIGGTGNAIGQFFLPAGAWSDAGDRIFIADMFNGRVMVFRYIGGSA
jgi:DNA-binding beta-propeller fold protein YncE